MGFHSDLLTSNGIHTPMSYSYADEAARTGATGFDANDLYKFAIQLDNTSVWMLTATTPTWTEIEAGSVTAGSGLTRTGDDIALGGTLTADAIFTPDTDGSHDFNIGADLSNRVANANLFASDVASINGGVTNDRSFVTTFGTTIRGIQIGYFLNEVSQMGFNINVLDDGNFEVADQINSKGMVYLDDYSANFTDRSLVDKGYVDGAFVTGNIYTTSGELTGNRTVTGNSNNNLTFNHYNGTSSTYTLRGEVLMDDSQVRILTALGDGFGADLAETSIDLLNSGMTITTGVGDTAVLQHSNEFIFYEGSSTSSTNLMTLHGDGNHSSFNPYVTLHEGFATSNGTNSQALLVNYGKGVTVKFNDGTRSVDVFSITSVVNGAETFTHMEHNYQGVQQDFLNIRSFNWYFDSTGSPVWTIYDDDAGSNAVFTLNPSGNLTVSGYGDFEYLAINSTAVAGRVINAQGPNNGDAIVEIDSANSALYDVRINLDAENSWSFISEHFETGVAFGDLVIEDDTSNTEFLRFQSNDVALFLPSAVEFRYQADTTTADYWIVDRSSDNLTFSYYDDSLTTTTLLLTLEPGGDFTAEAGSVKDQGGTLVVPFASQIVGTTDVSVTTTEQIIPLDSAPIDGSGSEYTIDLVGDEIDMDAADGSRTYLVTYTGRISLTNAGTTGSTRSFCRIKARLDAVDVAYSEEWAYVREWQGGTNGDPSTGISHGGFLIQPAANDVLDFVVYGTTDTGTLTDFDLVDFGVTIQRVA